MPSKARTEGSAAAVCSFAARQAEVAYHDPGDVAGRHREIALDHVEIDVAAAAVLSTLFYATAAIALAGFCFGCFLYYQFKLQRFRLLERIQLEAIVAWCAAKGVRFLSDEIYHGIVFGEPAASALEFTQDAIVINSFSKYFSMTGWRVGWMVMPEQLRRPVA